MTKKVLVFLATMLLINSTYANPEGGVVTSGSATISSPSANTVQVTQTTDKAIVNWQSFNISADETTRFVQPNSNSVALNRISPQQGASQIYGQLQANGKIILVNQAGIFFGPNAMVNVSGIIASATDITDANFLAGKYVFDQKSPYYNGSIINQGTLIAANNGLVALIGSAVSNEGMIQAHMGNVILASGNKFTVGFDDTGLVNFTVDEAISSAGLDQKGNTLKHGVNNSGTIIADGGTILMSAKSAQGVLDRVINMTGVAQARSVYEKNGVIILAGEDQGMTYVSGTLDASGINVGETGGIVKVLGHFIFVDSPAMINAQGDAGGGEIYIGGNYQGKGPLPNASTTYVASGANLFADAITQGNGGKVIVWANEATGFYGNISAQGGTNGGDGGFAETSGKNYLEVGDVLVKLNSPAGEAGTWLLDPTDITISTGLDANISFSVGNYTPTSGVITTSNINVTTLNTNLAGANNVVISTSSGAGGTGTITVNAGATAINWNSVRTLTMNAQSNITVSSAITSTNATAGAGGVTLNTSSGNIVVNSPISTSGGNILLTSPTNGSITLSAALSSVLGTININAPFGLVTLNSTISTTGGAAATVTATASLSMNINAGAGVTTNGAAQLYNASFINLASGSTIALNAGAGNITFGSGTNGMIDGAANLTLTSNGIIDIVGGHIGGSTPLTTFTTNGTGTLKSSGNTFFSPHVATTGNQVYNTKITAGTATPSVFLEASGAGSTIRLNNSITNTGGQVQLRAQGGAIMGCSGCGVNPTINAGTIVISNGIATPLTLLNATILTTNTASGTNTFSGAVSGAFALTLNEAASAIANFASTINIASLTTTGATSTIAFNGGNVTTSGAQVYGNKVTIGTPLTMTGSAITLANITTALDAGANNLTMAANTMTFSGGAGSVTGTGALTLTPSTANAPIGIQGGAGTLQLSSTNHFSKLINFSGLSIGATGATGTITVGAATNTAAIPILTLNSGILTGSTTNIITVGTSGSGTLNVKATGGAIGAAAASSIGFAAANLSFTTTANNNAFFNSTSTNSTTISSASTVGTGTVTFTNMSGSLLQSISGSVTAGTLVASLSGATSALNFGTATNAVANVGAVTAPAGLTLNNGNTATNVSAAINTVGSNGAITISTGTGGYSQANVDITSGSGAITITSNSIALTANTGGNAFTTTGALTLKPSTASTAMSLAGASAYDLSTSEITSIASGMTGGSIVIGDAAASTGVMTTGIAGGVAMNFGANNLTLNAGSFTNPGSAANIISANTLKFLARNSGGAIGGATTTTAIRIATSNLSFNTTGNGSASFASAAGATINAASSVGSGTLTFVSMGNTVSQTAGGSVTAGTLAATLTAGSLNLGTSSSNNITNVGAVTAPSGFTLNNGNNPTTVNVGINTVGANGPITINTGTAQYTQTDVDANSGSGAITITSDSISIANNTGGNALQTTGVLTLKPSTPTLAMSLAGSAAYDITAAEITSVISGLTGAGSLVIGDSAASTGNLNIGGNVNFGAKTVTLNAGSFTDTTSSVLTTTGTLNLVARNAGGAIGAQGASNAVNISATNLSLNTSNGSAFIASAGGTNFSGATNLGTGYLVLTSMGGTVSQSVSGTITAGQLIATLTAGALNLNTATFNNIGILGNYLIGNITAPGGFNLTTGNNPLNSGGVGGVTITTTNSPVNINTGTSSFTSTGTIMETGSGNITITADSLNLGNGASQFHTSGTVTLKPTNAATAMSIAGTSGAFNLTYDDIVQISNGSSPSTNIVIGDSALSTGVLTIVGAAQFAVFGTPTVSLYGGSIAASSASSSLIQAATLNLTARSAGGTIGSALIPITVDGTTASTVNLSVNTSNANAFLNLYNFIDLGNILNFSGASSVGSGTLNLSSTGAKTTVTQSGTGIITANTLTANFADAASSLSLNNASNVITNLSTITTPGGFSLTNGNNAIAVTGNISTTDSDVSISTGTGGYTQNNPNTISAGLGNITIAADTVAIGTAANAFNTQGVLTLKPNSAGTTMSLAGASTFDLSTTEIASLIGGVTGAGSIVIGNAANSTAVFTIGAASNFTGKTLTLNGGSFTDTGANVITANTLNLLARTGAIGAASPNAVGISASNLSLNTTNANAFITSAGGTNFSGTSNLGTGTLTMTMGGTVSQSATIAPITAGTLIATLSGGTSALNLNNSANAFTNLGAITAPGGFSLTNGNTSLTTTAAINTNTGNGFVTINTGAGTYSQNNVDINSGTGEIIIISDGINLTSNTGGNAFQTQSALRLKPSSGPTTMSLAGSASYDLTQAEITSFISGLGGGAFIDLGDAATSTGSLTVGGPVSFNTFTVNLYAGSFANASATNIITAGSLNFTAKNLNGAIGASGAANAIRVASALSALNITTNTNNGDAFIASAGNINIGTSALGTGNLTLTSVGGNVTQGGSIAANSLSGTLTSGSITLNNASNAISQLGAITAPAGLSFTNGNAAVTVAGNINTTNSAVTINAGTGTYAQNDFDISSGTGAINITADAVNIASNTGNNAFTTTGALTIKPSSAATAMSLAGSSAFDLSAAEIAALIGGITGSGTVTIGNGSTSTATMTIGGAVNFGTPSVTLAAGNFSDPTASVITANNLTFNPRVSGVGTALLPVAILVNNLRITQGNNASSYLTSTGSVNFGGGITSVGVGAITVNSGGAITQSSQITAGGGVFATAVNGITLNDPTNQIWAFGATNTTSGGISLVTASTGYFFTTDITQGGSGDISITNTGTPSAQINGAISTTNIGNIIITNNADILIGNTISSTSGNITLNANGNAINLNSTASPTISTTGGNINLNDPVTLSRASTLNASTGNINFTNTITGGGLALAATTSGSGATTFSNSVSGLSSLTVTGNANINTTGITTTGAQTYNNNVSLGAGTTFTSSGAGGITFGGTLNGLQALNIANSSGTITFGGIVGGTNALTSLTIGTGNTAAINTAGITTSGAQAYNGAVTLGAGSVTTLTSTGSGGISFGNTVNGSQGLSIANNSGAITFNSSATVGAGTALASLLIGTGNNTAINSTSVRTSGSQTYNSAITLGAASLTTLTSTGGNGITFNNTLNGSQGLSIANSSGAITFNSGATVGLSTALASLSIGTGNATAINTTDIRTSGSQSYSGAVTLGANATLTSTGAGGITFNNTLNGTQSLNIANSSGAVTFGSSAIVGGGTALTSLTIGTGNNTAINSTGITTSGAQTYNSAITLGAASLTTLTSTGASGITFNNTLDGSQGLSIANSSGAVTFGSSAVAGGGTALASLIIGTGNNTAINSTGITTSGAQTFNSAVTLGASSLTTLRSTGGSGITFGSTVAGPQALSIANNSGTLTFNNNIGSGTALASLSIGTGNPTAINTPSIGVIVTSGTQTYNSGVTLNSGNFNIFASTGGSGITFNSTLDGSRAFLTQSNTGLISFNGIVGGITPLINIQIVDGNPVAINTTSITTSSSQSYGSAVTLGAGSLTTLSGSGTFTFSSTLDGPQGLSIADGHNTVTFNGAVGTTPLASLLIGTGGNVNINANSITTSGSQTYNSIVNMGSGSPLTLTTTNGAVNFGSNITNTLPRDLTIDTGNAAITLTGNVGFGGAIGALTLNSTGITTIGNTINAASIITNAGGSTVINGSSLTTTGGQTYNDAVSFGGVSPIRTLTADAITFANTVDTAAIGLKLFADTAMTFSGGAASISGTGTLQLAPITTSKTIGVNGAAGDLSITSTDLAAISTGLSLFTIGQSGQSGLITLPTVAFNAPTTILSSSISASGNISTVGASDLTLSGAVALSGATTFSSGTGNINFQNAITGGNNTFATSTSGAGVTTFSGILSGIATLTTTGTTAINGGSITTSGVQNYNNEITIGADTTLASTDSLIHFGSTLDSATTRALTINAGTGDITFDNNIGGANALGAIALNSTGITTLTGTVTADSITTNAGGTTAINGGTITTTNAQNYNDAVTLGADSTFATTNSLVNFASAITNASAHALTVNAGTGDITFGDNVGAITALGDITLNSTNTKTLNGTINAASLTTQGGGITAINGGNVTTSGAQNYNDNVTLGSDTTINTTDNLVNFASNVDSATASALTVNAGAGGITLGNVGSGNALGAIQLNSTTTKTLGGTVNADSLITSAGGTTAINGGSVITVGLQTYNDDVTLGAGTFLQGTDITLNGVTGGAQSLTLSDAGTSVLNGALTGLSTLQTTAVTFNNGNVSTTGSQTYNGVATLGASAVLTSDSSDITFNNSLIGGAQSLTLTGGTGGDHIFTLNDIASLDTLTVNGDATVLNTLAYLANSGTNVWSITSTNTGSIAATNVASAGFNNIQTLMTGNASNKFVFSDGATLDGSIQAGGNAADNTLDISAYSTPITVNVFAGSVTSGLTNVTGFSNIYNLIGTDSGSTANSTILQLGNTTIDAQNKGSTNAGYQFTGFGNLGGDGDDTTFTFNANASITGDLTDTVGSNYYVFSDGSSIGGNLTGSGHDTLSVAGFLTPVTVNLSGSSSFVNGAITGINTFAGTDVGAGSNSTLQGPSGNNNWTFYAGTTNSGTIGGTIFFNDFGNIKDGSNNNSFIFEDNANITGNLVGGGADTLNFNAYSTPVSVNASGTSSTGIGGTFSGFATVSANISNSNSNTFTNAAGGKNWNITDDNIGTIDGIAFNNFGTLVGGSADTFALADGKSINSISATNGILDYSAYSTAVSVNTTNVANTATNVGTLSGITNFTGGAGSNTFTNTSGNKTWNISDNNIGSINGKNFTNFGALVGGSADTFALADGKSINSISATNGILDYSAYSTAVAVNTTNVANTATNVGSLTGISTFTGSAANASTNSFTNTSGSKTWNINDNNIGSINGKSFTNFGTLVGGSADTFALADGKSINSISATNGILDYSAYSTAVSVNTTNVANTATNVGTLSGITNFTGGAGSNTFTNTSGSNTWNISNNNVGSILGKNFTAFGNLTGGASDIFAFANNSAAITGNLTGGANSTLDVSALSSPTVDIQQHTSTNIGGTFSGVSNFVGNGASSSLVGPDNSIWHINSHDGGTVNGNVFTAFGNLIDGAGSNDFILESGGSIDGSITGGGTSNTLTVVSGVTQWTINGINAGTVTGVSGGFSNIQNLVGGIDTNTFTFIGNSNITGTINGGNTTNTNVIDYSGYTSPLTLNLAAPTSGNEFNSGSVNNQASTLSFTQIQSIIGPSTGTNILILPNNKLATITYTNAARTAGFIGDPFYFTNFIIQSNTPVPAPTPTNINIPDVAQIITPFNDPTSTPPTVTMAVTQSLNYIVDSNINQIIDQEISLDVKLAESLSVGCFQVQ